MASFRYFLASACLAALALPLLGRAQGVGIGTTAPDPSAVLDVKSTTKGLLLPRLTAAQRTAIANPAEGLLVSQTNLVKGPYYFDGSTWTNLITGTYGTATDNTGTSTQLSGQSEAGSTDGNAGAAAAFRNPAGVALDGSGNLYVADGGGNGLRQVALAAGTVSTVAGNGTCGNVDGTGRAAQFCSPPGVAVAGGSAYVTIGYPYNLRKVVLATGVVTTLPVTTGVDSGIASDASGNLYSGGSQSKVIKYNPSTGVVTTIAGGTYGYQDGTGTAARFASFSGLAVDASATNLYVADRYNNRIRQVVLATGVVTTLAGNGNSALVNGTGPANTSFAEPVGLALDGSGNLYVADYANNVIRKVVLATGTVSTLATGLNQPIGLAYESSSNSLYVGDYGSNQIRRVVLATGQVSTVAGSPGGGYADGQTVVGRFNSPRGVAVSAAGVSYVADAGNHAIRQVSAAGVVSTLAGTTGSAGTADGTGAAARFNTPSGVALDGSGTVYVADAGNHTIRKITPAGVVTTLAGTAGSTGTADGTGAAARFNTPTGVAVDAAGNVYVADRGNHAIRKITPAGVVTTLAGTAGTAGAVNGSGPAASFNAPTGLAATAAGTLYVADAGNHLIRQVTAAGVVSTLAGQAGVAGQTNGGGSVATFNTPVGVALAPNGALCVADQNNHLIREVSATTGATTTLAGSTAGYTEGSGTAARFKSPMGVTIAADGTVYVADTGNNQVRKLQEPILAPENAPLPNRQRGVGAAPALACASGASRGAEPAPMPAPVAAYRCSRRTRSSCRTSRLAARSRGWACW